MSKHISLLTNELKSIILNHKYPDGNVRELLKHCTLFYVGATSGVDISLYAPEWAYTNAERPKRFHVSGLDVMDRGAETDHRCVATFERYSDAIIVCDMLNNREEKEPEGSGI